MQGVAWAERHSPGMQIIGMLSAQNIFYRPREKQAQADQKKAKFFQPEGDHMTLLAVYEGWKTSKFSKPWAYENFVQERSLKRAQVGPPLHHVPHATPLHSPSLLGTICTIICTAKLVWRCCGEAWAFSEAHV